MAKRVLFIGGSPCSGKSTIAERISKEYGAYYFKVDDFLDKFIGMAADKGYLTEENKIPCITNDGFRTRNELFSIVKELFSLK